MPVSNHAQNYYVYDKKRPKQENLKKNFKTIINTVIKFGQGRFSLKTKLLQ